MAPIIINAILAPFCGIGIGVSVGFVCCKVIDVIHKLRMRRLQTLIEAYKDYEEKLK